MDTKIRRTRDRILSGYPGRRCPRSPTVTSIKLLARLAVGAPLDAVYKMELAPASVTVDLVVRGRYGLPADVQRRPMESAFIGRWAVVQARQRPRAVARGR